MTPLETQLFFARAVLLVLLYTFLAAVGIVVWFDLRAAHRPAAARAAEPAAARLIVLQAGQSNRPPGTSFLLAPVTALGRDLDNDVVLQDATISGRHAVVSLSDGEWWIEDLGSTNGTLVNGRPAGGHTPLLMRTGDVLQVGAVRLRLVDPEPSR